MSYSSEVLADSPAFFINLDDAPVGAADAAGGADWSYVTGVTAGLSPLLSDGGTSVHGTGSAGIAAISSIPSGLTGSNVTLEAWVSLPGTNVQGSFV